MKKLLIAFAVAALGAGCCSAAYAQSSSSPATSPTPPAAAQPDQSQMAPGGAPGEQPAPNQATPSQSTQADLTGQMIYSEKGHKLGTVSSMTTDAQGQQAAVVSMERFLGMGGKSVVIPVAKLEARSAGGYTANLTASEIKKLPEAGGAAH
ncbi:MAG: PRC-barrel domain-containing protein [Alphaproteobacteria bacterium]|nr:PRC-barrel domain-containing protein [Alphaproteobacteria bacterium]MDE2110556.1 PRC-barrel domain-containing protein [Alphaproteobacteria bacterium]MDE2492716.1 PRC-barrel domain-containing protein [Alphaproteobacteria bacterium]